MCHDRADSTSYQARPMMGRSIDVIILTQISPSKNQWSNARHEITLSHTRHDHNQANPLLKIGAAWATQSLRRSSLHPSKDVISPPDAAKYRTYCVSSQPCVKLSPTAPAIPVQPLFCDLNSNLVADLESTASICLSYSPVNRPVHRMDDPNASLSTDGSNEESHGGVLAGVKHHINSMTAGVSVTEIQQNITTAAGETVNDLKETVVDNVVPAAGEALQSAQASISALAGKAATESASQVEKGMFLGSVDFAWLH